jgi:epoxyqueuosine reductase QueG
VPARISLRPLAALRSGDYRRLTAGSATRRATRAMWQRNAAIALRNVARADTLADASRQPNPTRQHEDNPPA